MNESNLMQIQWLSGLGLLESKGDCTGLSGGMLSTECHSRYLCNISDYVQ